MSFVWMSVDCRVLCSIQDNSVFFAWCWSGSASGHLKVHGEGFCWPEHRYDFGGRYVEAFAGDKDIAE